MRKTKNTYLVQELIKRGLTRHNAHRIINESTGQAAMILRDVLKELIELKDMDRNRPGPTR